jgi:hypothetical protein
VYRLLKGVKISISMDRNVDNEFITGYGQKPEALKSLYPSSLKPLRQLKPNCPGMIIGRSSTKFLFFMPIGNPRWPPPQDIDHIGIKNAKFVEDHPMNILVQFGFNNICSF